MIVAEGAVARPCRVNARCDWVRRKRLARFCTKVWSGTRGDLVLRCRVIAAASAAPWSGLARK